MPLTGPAFLTTPLLKGAEDKVRVTAADQGPPEPLAPAATEGLASEAWSLTGSASGWTRQFHGQFRGQQPGQTTFR